jgi:hypothetical protein
MAWIAVIGSLLWLCTVMYGFSQSHPSMLLDSTEVKGMKPRKPSILVGFDCGNVEAFHGHYSRAQEIDHVFA